MYLTIGLLFIVGSSLLMHMVFFAEEFMWVPRHTKDTLFISAVSYCFVYFPHIKMYTTMVCVQRYKQRNNVTIKIFLGFLILDNRLCVCN